MKKKYIFFILTVIIIVSIFFFYSNSENNEKEFVKPKIAFKNSLYSVRLKYRDLTPEFNIANINSKNKEKFDEDLRIKLLELLNMPLESIPSTQIYDREIDSIDKGTYIQSHISLLTSNSTNSFAYLLVPKNITFPAPTIIAMHQHGEFYEYGKEEIVGNIGNPDLFYAKELAERGYIVFAMDAPFFGERFDAGDKASPQIVEEFIAQSLFILNRPPLGVIVQEDLVSLEFLNVLNIVDKDNIGCIGHSFGGTRCMYLAALDNRVKAVALSNSVANIKQTAGSGITSSWLSILPGVAEYAETDSILALIAPRPLLILYTEKDPIFLADQTETQINSVKELYSKLNKDDNFKSIFIPNQAHSFPKEYHEQVYDFFDKNLKEK